jgi:hypothetical protein
MNISLRIYLENEKKNFLTCFCETKLTENECVQALVVHVLVYQYPLVPGDAAAQQPHKVFVLKLGDQLHLVLELHNPLR